MSGVVGDGRPYFNTQPDYRYPPYRSTIKRSPAKLRVMLPHTLSEVPGPVFGTDDVKPGDSDLTRQHDGEPLDLVFRRGSLRRLLTRLHFLDDSAFAQDPIFKRLPADRRATLIAPTAAPATLEWDIHMQGASETARFDF